MNYRDVRVRFGPTPNLDSSVRIEVFAQVGNRIKGLHVDMLESEMTPEGVCSRLNSLFRQLDTD